MRIVAPRNHVPKEFVGIHPMSSIMRTGVDAAWLGVLGTKIARGGLLLGDYCAFPRRVGILGIHFEGVQRYVAIRAVLRAQSAADAPILNDHFK